MPQMPPSGDAQAAVAAGAAPEPGAFDSAGGVVAGAISDLTVTNQTREYVWRRETERSRARINRRRARIMK